MIAHVCRFWWENDLWYFIHWIGIGGTAYPAAVISWQAR
jgi:hypothetical protein